ncbi:unnamed protein product [Acanthosepion pharaonis]|uniref:Uncharacterized protein n=1 Tax=Acanthosepion pharaonis TaxID=158019 RepID=A0A812BCJ9_ACAPH|nr:unnamed protein product [Sepia pharaonis]
MRTKTGGSLTFSLLYNFFPVDEISSKLFQTTKDVLRYLHFIPCAANATRGSLPFPLLFYFRNLPLLTHHPHPGPRFSFLFFYKPRPAAAATKAPNHGLPATRYLLSHLTLFFITSFTLCCFWRYWFIFSSFSCLCFFLYHLCLNFIPTLISYFILLPNFSFLLHSFFLSFSFSPRFLFFLHSFNYSLYSLSRFSFLFSSFFFFLHSFSLSFRSPRNFFLFESLHSFMLS